MNNTEIAQRLRYIIRDATTVNNTSGSIDFATNHCYMITSLTELLLDIIKAP